VLARCCSAIRMSWYLSDDIYDQIWFRDEPMTNARGRRAGVEGSHPSHQWRLEIIRDDRLAHRLCDRSGG